MSPADGSNAGDLPEILVDLNNARTEDFFGINTVGAEASFKQRGLSPREDVRIKVRDENLAAAAVTITYEYNHRKFVVAKLTVPHHEIPLI